MLKTKLARRILAALWFAAVACVPVGLYLLLWGVPGAGPMQFLLVAVPILAAGTGGSILGAGILERGKVRSVFGALARGLAIALLSYLVMFVSLLTAISYHTGDLPKAFDLISTVFLYGLLSIGWLIAAAGAAAGGLLYIFQFDVPPSEP